jgi:competence protein ComEC
MRSNLPADAADVAESVVFGADDLMPQDRAAYRQAGAISVMSAAGMQVYLLATIAFWLLRLLPISRPIQLLAISVLLVALVLAGGMHAGAIRACVVLLLSSAAYFFRREPDVLSALALAALFELVLVPYRVYDLGFQTSFLVVTSVVLYVPGMSGYLIAKQGLWPVVRRALVFLFVATFASAPLIAYQSGTFEFANPLASLMIAPAVPFVFSFGLLVWLLTPVSEVIAHGLSAVFLGPLCGWCLAVIETCGRHPLVSLETPVLNGYWLAPYYALLGLGARISSKALRGSVG